jgi:hypothetical protein
MRHAREETTAAAAAADLLQFHVSVRALFDYCTYVRFSFLLRDIAMT